MLTHGGNSLELRTIEQSISELQQTQNEIQQALETLDKAADPQIDSGNINLELLKQTIIASKQAYGDNFEDLQEKITKADS